MLTDAQAAEYEANDPWSHSLVATLQSFLTPLKGSMLTGDNTDNLIAVMASSVTSEIERLVLTKKFNQLGGLQLDRDIRSVLSFFISLNSSLRVLIFC